MNILSRKRYKELVLGKHIVFVRQTKGSRRAVIQKGIKGIITSMYEDSIEVLLETGNFVLLNKNDAICFADRNDFDLKNAAKYVTSLRKHYCSNDYYVQFNIKYNNLPTVPQIVEKKLPDNLIMSHINSLEEDAIRSFCDDSFMDTPILSFFDSVTDWSIEGRSGGYLVLKMNRGLWDTYYDIEYCQELLIEIMESDPEDISVQDVKEKIKELSDVFIDIAYDLDLIARLIEAYKQSLLDTISDIDTWSDLLEEHKEEKEEKGNIMYAIC